MQKKSTVLLVLIMVLSLIIPVYADDEIKVSSGKKSIEFTPWEKKKINFKITDENLKKEAYWSNEVKLKLHFNSIDYTGNKYIAAADLYSSHPDASTRYEVACMSEDAINWEIVKGDTISGTIHDHKFKDILWKNGMFIGVGKTIMTSTDGINWEKSAGDNEATVRVHKPGDNRTYVYPKDFEKVKKVNNKFVAFGRSFYLYVSDDGKTWTKIKINSSNEYKAEYPYLNDVLWDGNKYIGIMVDIIEGGGGIGTDIVTSHDLKTWTKQNAFLFEQKTVKDVRYVHNKVDGVRYKNGKPLKFTRDVVTREEYEKKEEPKRTPLRKICPKLNSIIWDGSKYIAVGSNADWFWPYAKGEILISTDGIEWVRPSNYKPVDKYFKKIVYENNQYIVIGNHGVILTSNDCENWTAIQKYDFNPQKDSEDIYVGELSTSNDCKNWTVIHKNILNAKTDSDDNYVGMLNDIIWDGEKYIAVGDDNTVFFSKTNN